MATINTTPYLSKEFQSRLVKIYNTAFGGVHCVTGYLAAMPSFSCNATWNSGTINALIGTVNNLLNFVSTLSKSSGGAVKSAGILEWQGSDPLNITLPILFHYDQPFGYNGTKLSENVRQLAKLTLPSGNAPSLNETEPGRNTLDTIKEGLSKVLSDDLVNTAVDYIGNFSGGQVAPAGYKLNFGDSANFKTLVGTGATAGTGIYGLSGITIIQNRRIILRIPQQWLVTTGINFTASNQNDHKGGPRWIKAEVQMKTFIAPTADVFQGWFKGGITYDDNYNSDSATQEK